jgi:hypothetical protein
VRGGEAGARAGKGKGREREREREEGGAHLGIQKPVITVTGSPRANRWEREVEERERERELLRGKSNERDIERGAHWGCVALGARRAGSGWVAGQNESPQHTHDH